MQRPRAEAEQGSQRRLQQGLRRLPQPRVLRGTRSQSLHLLNQRIFPVDLRQKNLEETRQRPSQMPLAAGTVGQGDTGRGDSLGQPCHAPRPHSQ